MSSTFKRKLINSIIYILGVLFVIVLYQIFALWKQNTAFNKDTMKILVPNFNKIFAAFIKLFGYSSTYIALLNTFYRLFLSIIIGGFIGIFLGIFAGKYNWLRTFLKPLMTVFKGIPVVILVIILMLSINRNSYIPVISTIIIVIPVFYHGTVEGIKSIDKDMIDAYRMYSNFNLRVIMQVYMPAISHYLKASLITSISFGIKVMISTDYLSQSNNTLGYLIMSARANLEYAKVYAYLILILVIIVLLEFLFEFIKSEE